MIAPKHRFDVVVVKLGINVGDLAASIGFKRCLLVNTPGGAEVSHILGKRYLCSRFSEEIFVCNEYSVIARAESIFTTDSPFHHSSQYT